MWMDLVFRLIGGAFFGFLGWRLGLEVVQRLAIVEPGLWLFVATSVGALLGLTTTPLFTVRPWLWAQKQVRLIPVHLVVTGTLGLLAGAIVAALLTAPLSLLPGLWGQLSPLLVTLLLGYLGVFVAVSRGRDLMRLFGVPLVEESFFPQAAGRDGRILLDTSAIIDGRVADLSQTGFIPGRLIVPKFVLNELQRVADSPDAVKRNRGRRGLEMLNRLQKESNVPIQIEDADVPEFQEVDSKLVTLAKRWRCPILTIDFNLNRVAELQGVSVLNVNQLANALKPVVLPGEEMTVNIVQEGKEFGQGLAFLDDGTMVVVEGGRRFLNLPVPIIVTRVLQTAAGRIIFAHPKAG